MRQTPEPGSRHVRFRGDCFEFSLHAGTAGGQAWLRTNLGRAAVRRREIIRSVERREPALARDWHDIPMRPAGPGRFAAVLPLTEVGWFEAKAFFIPDGSDRILWPAGGNVAVKVEPADCVAANAIYTAYVRQFGPGKSAASPAEDGRAAAEALEKAGFSVLPRSGTFRDLTRELDFIIGTLGFRIIQLLPIHPTPTTYGRMGPFGSAFASLDYMNVDPALAEFDRRTTPLDQFRELTDAVHERGARLFIDLPINHTGWASWLQVHHPEWFARNHDSSFQSPGAWGVTWEDLSRLDYSHRALWEYMAQVFLFWCRMGVDGFRCDAGYMVPAPVWTYLVARTREEFPDAVFLLEGLGGKIETTEELLSRANLDWAYSELFQTHDRHNLEPYLAAAAHASETQGLLVHFAETHDNLRLASVSPAFSRMRTGLCALTSSAGGFGITAGVEWFATSRVDVHGAPPLNWGAPDNQVDFIAQLNRLLAAHPCFEAGARTQPVSAGPGNRIVVLRSDARDRCRVLAVVNLDMAHACEAAWPPDTLPGRPETLVDLLSGRRKAVEWRDGLARLSVNPGDVLCLAAEDEALPWLETSTAPGVVWEVNRRRQVQACALDLVVALNPAADFAAMDPAAMAARLRADPLGFCAEVRAGAYAPVIPWTWPADARRTVMLPPEHILLVRCPHAFRAELVRGERTLAASASIPADDGTHFAFMNPHRTTEEPGAAALRLAVHESGRCRRTESPLLVLAGHGLTRVHPSLSGSEALRRGAYAVCVNARGALVQARAAWAEVTSLYDALLAANLHPSCPSDRHALLTRCRAWLVHRDYSHTIDGQSLERFAATAGHRIEWRMNVPAGMGKSVRLRIRLDLHPEANAVRLRFTREPAGSHADALGDASVVRIILRPDIEDRSVHGTTKAYLGPEGAWRQAVRGSADGFVFRPGPGRGLSMRAAPGLFTVEPEWTYNVGHPFEADRGLPDASDLFSPGYFALTLAGGASADLFAEHADAASAEWAERVPPSSGDPGHAAHGPPPAPIEEAMRRAVRQFIVRRDDSLTILAGHPWFLDWGRDTLICLRGLIAAGMTGEAASILRQFARFESRGTLPNMLRAADSSNRDTSDAPLWFIVACEDLVGALGSDDFLHAPDGSRPVSDVIRSIVDHYAAGTPNGIRMDPASGLVYSPAHFTWMDTNFPAATPRAGYPVEIQSLWIRALGFAARLPNADPRWAETAARAVASLDALFGAARGGDLADCLHAAPGTPAAKAAADDALRPNQLLAVTLGAVRDAARARSIVQACSELVVPGAIRSLADRPVELPLPVWRDGVLLNDPRRPYWGQYRGDEDTRRKPAYHNGTAWTWLFPSYAEALVAAWGESARAAALDLLSCAAEVIDTGCLGHIPELLDGDAPHAARGCGAQSWGATELLRVLVRLATPR